MKKDFMQLTAHSPRLKNLKYLVSFVCLILGLTVYLPQGQAVQQVQQTQTLNQNSSPAGEKDKSRFTLNVKDVNLRDVLLMLIKSTPYSLIMEPGIDTVLPALDLKDVTFEEALQTILSESDLEYRLDGNLLKVRKPDMQTRLFYMNYIAASRSGKRNMLLSSRSQIGNNGSGVSNSSGFSGSGGQSGSGSSGGSSTENESTIITANNSEIWTDLKLGLESIIFPGEILTANENQSENGPMTSAVRDASGRRLLVNPQAGVIMIRAEPPVLDEAANYIEAVDGSVQRQVLIEARVVEVTLSKDYQLGINWSAILNPGGFTGLLSDSLGVTSPSAGLDTGSVINQNVNASMGRFVYSISNGRVGAIIDGLSRQGQLRVLSSPHISALNNQKAVIRVVREEVFFTQTSMVSQSVGPTVTTENIENQIVPIGVVLDIIPQISADGEITLSINPSISELVEVRTFSSKEGEAVSTQPVIDRRDLDTVAKVHSGETVLIAGIMRERKGEDIRGVPWLMNLPFLGNAFRRTEQSSMCTELVIFITPTLIRGKRIEELTEQKMQELKEMEQPFKLGTVEPIKQGLKGEVGQK